MRKQPQVAQKGKTSQSDAVVRDNSRDDTPFVLDMLHTATDTIESQHEGNCLPKAKECAKKSKVKNQITDVG